MNRFCSGCGNKVEAEQTFCPECGAQQQGETTVVKRDAINQAVPAPPRKPLSFKKKLSFALIVLLAIGLTAGHQIIKANTAPQQKVDAFLQALYDGDTDRAMGEIILPELAGADLESFQIHLADQDLTDFKYRLYEAAGGAVEDGITRIVFHENGSELFRIKESNFIGIYPGIQIEVIPMDISLIADVEGVQFTLGEAAVSTKKGEQELGAFLPGEYNCSLSMKNGDVEQMLESECSIVQVEDAVIELDFMEISAEIQSDYDDAIVFINGKSTGKTVKELPLVGPIEPDTTIDLFVERKNEKGELEQSEVTAAEGGSIAHLPIVSEDAAGSAGLIVEKGEIDEELTEDVLQLFMADFRSAYQSSLNHKDFSYIDGYLEEGSIAREELVDFIGNIGDDFYLYEFLIDEAVDFQILADKAFVTTYEEFDFTNHLDVVTNYKRSKKYEVHLAENGELRIAKIDIIDTVRDN